MPNTLFGNWEANWVGFNHARDFDLYPQPELAPLNNFGYPYAEIGGDPLNSFDPKEFKYDYCLQKALINLFLFAGLPPR